MATSYGMTEYWDGSNTKYILNDLNNADEFNETLPYKVGNYCYYKGYLFKFVVDHAAGEWDYDHVQSVRVTTDLYGAIGGINTDHNKTKSVNLNDDLNDYTVPGNYKIGTSAIAQSLANAPAGIETGRLTVFTLYADGRILQRIDTIQMDIYIRVNAGTNWSSWKRIVVNSIDDVVTNPFTLDGALGKSLQANDDLNDYMTPGNYIIPNSSVANTLLNRPKNGITGRLTVFSTILNTRVTQRLDLTDGDVFIRSYMGSAWTGWKSFTDSFELNTNNVTRLSAGDDLNNYKAPGNYLIPNEIISKQLYNNVPYVGSSRLTVYDIYMANRVCQEMMTPYRKYMRTFDGADWSEWSEVITENTMYQPISSAGVANVIENAYRFVKATFKALATLPQQSGDIASDTVIRGIPYSSAKYYDKLVGLDVSFYTFMTAAKNPRSVLYTRQLNPSYNSKTFYGAICSSIVSYSLGFDRWLGSDMFKYDDTTFPVIENLNEVQPGDLFSKDGHIGIISGIMKNRHGKVLGYEVIEAISPLCRMKMYSTDEFTSMLDESGYVIKRYVDIENVQLVNESFTGNTDKEVPDLDICTEYGDKALIPAGVDVYINVLNTDDYTEFHLFKDGTKIGEYELADVQLQGLSYGDYDAKLCDGNGYVSGQDTKFTVCDVTISRETGKVNFSNIHNCTPKQLAYCQEEGSVVAYKDITSEDIENGYVVDDYSGEYAWLKMMVDGDYGRTSLTVWKA